MGRVDGRRIVVTGGARGLGAEFVRALHAEGAVVVIADVATDAGLALAEELGERCHVLQTDVTVEESVRASFAKMNEAVGGIDILINNAGLYPHQPLAEITLADWRNVMRVNLDGVFICSATARPYMKAGGGGKIVNITTNLVWIMAPDMAHYIASKAGVVGFTRAAARELGSENITINALAPGAIMPDEELTSKAMSRMREILSYQVIQRPQFAIDLIGALIFLCSDDSDFMTGQVLCVDGGVAAR